MQIGLNTIIAVVVDYFRNIRGQSLERRNKLGSDQQIDTVGQDL